MKIKKEKEKSREENSQNNEKLSQRNSPWTAQKIYIVGQLCEKIRSLNKKSKKFNLIKQFLERMKREKQMEEIVLYEITQEYFQEPKSFHCQIEGPYWLPTYMDHTKSCDCKISEA